MLLRELLRMLLLLLRMPLMEVLLRTAVGTESSVDVWSEGRRAAQGRLVELKRIGTKIISHFLAIKAPLRNTYPSSL